VSDWVQRNLAHQSDPERFAEACSIIRRMRAALVEVLATHKTEGPHAQQARLRAAGVLVDYKDGPR
jgi:hypothetical protein